MAEPFYGSEYDTPGIPEMDEIDRAIAEGLAEERRAGLRGTRNMLTVPFGATPELPPTPAPPRPRQAPPGVAPQVDEKMLESVRAEMSPDAIDRVMSESGSSPSRSALISGAAQGARPITPKSSLGFSWGGAPVRDYTPGDDIRGGDFGSAPSEDVMVRDQLPNVPGSAMARQSTGGGEFSQSDIEDIPLGQRPESWWDDQIKSAGLEDLKARSARARAEQEDPFAELRARGDIEGDLLGRRTDEELRLEDTRSGRYMDEFSSIEGDRLRRLGMLRSSPEYRSAAPTEQQMYEDQLNSAFDTRIAGLQGGTSFGTRFAPRFGTGGGFGVR